jgi:hypothetical protein
VWLGPLRSIRIVLSGTVVRWAELLVVRVGRIGLTSVPTTLLRMLM